MRVCKKCEGEYPLDQFCKTRSGGYSFQCKECKRIYDREYRKKNWDRLYSQIKEYEKNNPERIQAIRARSKKKHASRRNVEWHRRHAMLKGAEGAFTLAEWESLCLDVEYKCLACGEQKDLTKDHVVSLVNGGTNWISNIQPLCQPCNSRKNKSNIDYRPDWIKSKYAGV